MDIPMRQRLMLYNLEGMPIVDQRNCSVDSGITYYHLCIIGNMTYELLVVCTNTMRTVYQIMCRLLQRLLPSQCQGQCMIIVSSAVS